MERCIFRRRREKEQNICGDGSRVGEGGGWLLITSLLNSSLESTRPYWRKYLRRQDTNDR